MEKTSIILEVGPTLIIVCSNLYSVETLKDQRSLHKRFKEEWGWHTSSDKGDKRKSKQMRLHQTKEILHSKGNHQQNEKTTYWMGEDICQWYI